MKNITLLKLFYLILFIGMASIVAFLPVIYKDRGFSGEQIGLLMGIPPLVAIFSASVWGILADLLQQRNRLLAIGLGGILLGGIGLSIDWPFALMLLFATIFSFCSSPTMTLADTTAVATLKDNPEQYGRIRLWGSLGWIAGAAGMGRLADAYGLPILYVGFTIALLSSIFIALQLGKEDQSSTEKTQQYWQYLGQFMKNKRWLIFMGIICLIGVCVGIDATYVSLYMEESLGATNAQIGYASSIGALAEIAVFFFSKQLLKKIPATKLLLIALLLYGIRLVLVQYATNVPQIFLIQLMHGVTFAPSWIAGVNIAKQLSPTGLETTAQGIMASIYVGVGRSIGAFLGGFLKDGIGLELTFGYTGRFIVAVAIILIIAIRAGWIELGKPPANKPS